LPSIIKVDQIQSDQGFVNLSSNLQFSSGFTMLSPTLSSPTLTTPTTSGILTLGAGIKFPATQVPSTDANTLDDYEEGTWTPDLKFNGANSGMTYTINRGLYTKIGKFVYLFFDILLSNKGSSSGTATIEGVPFGPQIYGHGVVDLNSGMSSIPGASTYVLLAGNVLYLRYNNTTQYTDLSNSNFTNSSYIIGNCFFYALN